MQLRRPIMAALAAAALAVPSSLATGSASAVASVIPNTSGPSCSEAFQPWPCTQVFGNGDFIVQMNGWAHSTAPYTISNLHIELTYVDTSGTAHFIKNCATFQLKAGANSPNCIWTPNHTEPTGDYRTTVWSCDPGCTNLGTSDVAVHP